MFRSVTCSSHFPEIGGQSGCRHSSCRSLLGHIIVTGQTKAEHIEYLRHVLEALDNYGLKLQLDKCAFFAVEVSYLGYIVSKD